MEFSKIEDQVRYYKTKIKLRLQRMEVAARDLEAEAAELRWAIQWARQELEKNDQIEIADDAH